MTQLSDPLSPTAGLLAAPHQTEIVPAECRAGRALVSALASQCNSTRDRNNSMPTATTALSALDLTHIRTQFPSLSQTVNGHPAAFLDSPGGTQVPPRVSEAIVPRVCSESSTSYTLPVKKQTLCREANAAA